MRLTLTLGCPQKLPFNHLPVLVAAFHKWTDYNSELHNTRSLYSLSGLSGGRAVGGGLIFPGQAQWVISAPDATLMERVLGGLVLEPELSDYGLYVEDVQITPEPIFTDGARRFDLLSPVFLKNPTGPEVVGPADHLRYDDPRAQEVLTGALRNKLTAAGLDPTGVKVAFFDPYPAAKVRLQQYRDITNRVNKCPVVVTGSAAQQRFAWLVGAGHSTGIGFGALR